jgi:alpha-glucosidase
MAYIFNLLTERFSPEHIRHTVEEMEARIGDGWPCWSFSNHDVTRVMTRWGGVEAPEGMAKVLMALLLSLRGSVCIYQGEELALTEATIPRDRLRDPYGINFWPEFKGRDGCRTPLPWASAAPHAGFSDVEPWLPVDDVHRLRAVDVQERTADSVLNAYRAFLAWRRKHAALRIGSIRFVDAPPNCLALLRESPDERVLALFNLGAVPTLFWLPAGAPAAPLEGHGFAARVAADRVELPPFGAFFARLSG